MALRKAATMGDLHATSCSGAQKGVLCAACMIDEEQRPAVKFCLECCQAICQTCVDCHRRIKHLRNHKIVDNKDQDAVKVAQMLDLCLKCPKHKDKNIELMCMDHNDLCCSTCATVNHRGCRDVQEVSEQLEVMWDFSEPQVLMQQLNETKTYMAEIVKQLKTHSKELQTQVNITIPNQVKKMKARVMKAFNELENSLLADAQEYGKRYLQENETEISQWKSRIKTVDDRKALLNVAKENGDRIHKYIAANQVQKTLDEVSTFDRQNLKQIDISINMDSMKQSLVSQLNEKFVDVSKGLLAAEDRAYLLAPGPRRVDYSTDECEVLENFGNLSITYRNYQLPMNITHHTDELKWPIRNRRTINRNNNYSQYNRGLYGYD